MKCKACKTETHIICGLKLDCPCCQNTLHEMQKDNEEAYKQLIKRLGRKNVETEIATNDTGKWENRNLKKTSD